MNSDMDNRRQASQRDLNRHCHRPSEKDQDVRASCVACVLSGTGEHTDNDYGLLTPNHCAWELIYAEAGAPIPRRYRPALMAFLQDPKPSIPAYQENVRSVYRHWLTCPAKYNHHVGTTCLACGQID